jgi:hypothetical protein
MDKLAQPRDPFLDMDDPDVPWDPDSKFWSEMGITIDDSKAIGPELDATKLLRRSRRVSSAPRRSARRARLCASSVKRVPAAASLSTKVLKKQG